MSTGGGRGRGVGWELLTNFQLLILSPNLLKSKFPYVHWGVGVVGGGGGGVGRFGYQLPTFDPESKSAKTQISLCPWGGVWWVVGD